MSLPIIYFTIFFLKYKLINTCFILPQHVQYVPSILQSPFFPLFQFDSFHLLNNLFFLWMKLNSPWHCPLLHIVNYPNSSLRSHVFDIFNLFFHKLNPVLYIFSFLAYGRSTHALFDSVKLPSSYFQNDTILIIFVIL